MYIPDHSKNRDEKQIVEIMKLFPFVTLVSVDGDNLPYISHIPVSTQFSDGKPTKILGHFSKRNPHVSILRNNPKITVVFNGPHTYVTPKWYRSGRDVPTWNYSVVHIGGTIKFLKDEDSIMNILKVLTLEHESGPSPWAFELPEDLAKPGLLASAIIGFEIVPEKIESKFKLSLNRSEDDQLGIIEGLKLRSDDMSAEIIRLMQKNL